MFQVRFHGRGGQGVVTAADLLSMAAFSEGRFAQAIPSFGSERMGAPVVAFCRIAERPIRTREPVLEPDAVVVGDPTLLHQADLYSGLVAGGLVLVNSARPAAEIPAVPRGRRLAVVPATELGRAHVGRPVPNAALLGGLAALSGRVGLPAVVRALEERFGGTVGRGNGAAAEAGYRCVSSEIEEAGGARTA